MRLPALMLLLIVTVTCKSNDLKNVKQNHSRSSYGLGFGDTSVHLPGDSIMSLHDTTRHQNDERLRYVKKNYDDSIAYWKQRSDKFSKQTDSIFMKKVNELHLSHKDVQFVKILLDSLNNLNKWEVEMWEHSFIKDYDAYLKWSWMPNARIRDSILLYKNQLNEKKVQAKWDFDMKVYRLQGM